MIFQFLPEVFLFGFAALSTFLKYFYNKEIKKLVFLLIAAAICFLPIYGSVKYSSGMFLYKYHESILKSLLIFSASILYKFVYDSDLLKQNLVILSIIGAMLMLSSNDFLSLLFSMELSIIPILILSNRKKILNISNRFDLYWVLSTIIFIFVIFLMQIFIKSTNFSELKYASLYHQSKLLTLIVTIIFIAFSMKLGAFLLHFGILDSFKKDLRDIAIIFCVIRASLIFVFYKLITAIFYYIDISHILLLTACISLIFASILITSQTSFKKIIAYFSIYNTGIVFLCSSCRTQESLNAIIFFIVSEMIFMLGIFILLTNIKKNKNKSIEYIDDLDGISMQYPTLAISISVLFLSLFGLAPFLGFWSKFFICLSLFSKDIIFSLIIYIVTFAINLIVLSKIVNAIWFRQPQYGTYFIISNENVSKIICFISLLTIASIPFVHKLVYLIRMEIY